MVYDIEVAASPREPDLKSCIQPSSEGFQAKTARVGAQQPPTSRAPEVPDDTRWFRRRLAVRRRVRPLQHVRPRRSGPQLALLRAAQLAAVRTAVLGEALAVGLVALSWHRFVLALACGLLPGRHQPRRPAPGSCRTIIVALVVGPRHHAHLVAEPARRVSRVHRSPSPRPCPSPPVPPEADDLRPGHGDRRGVPAPRPLRSTSNGLATVGVGVVLIFPASRAERAVLPGGWRSAPLPASRASPGVCRERGCVTASIDLGRADDRPGLVGFAVFAASIKTSTADVLQSSVKADYIITPSSFAQNGFSPDLASSMQSNPAFSTVSAVRQGFAGLDNSTIQLEAIDPATITDTFNIDMLSGSLSGLSQDGLLSTRRRRRTRTGRSVRQPR